MSEVLSLQTEAVAALAVECENCVGVEVNRTVSFSFAALSHVLRVSVFRGSCCLHLQEIDLIHPEEVG